MLSDHLTISWEWDKKQNQMLPDHLAFSCDKTHMLPDHAALSCEWDKKK